MFASFDSVSTPSVKTWDFSRSIGGSALIRIALEDDCAPVQWFGTGGTTSQITLQLPTGSVPGKTITIKNDRLNTNTQPINIIDPVSGAVGGGTYLIGQGHCVTFICVPQVFWTSSAASPVQWVPLFGSSGQNALNRDSSVLSGSNNSTNSSFAVVVGGTNNTASGQYSAVGGGSSNAASGSNSFVGGGASNTASGSGAVVFGGASNTASGQNSAVLGGNLGTTRSISGYHAIAACVGPLGATPGFSQTGILHIAKQTTNASATVLTSTSGGAASGNQLVLPNNSAYFVIGSVIANVTAGGDTKAWEFTAAIKRGANAASTVLVGTPSVTSPYGDTGASGWTVALSADTTSGALAVTVTGQAATTIRWVCKLESTEVTF